MFFCFLILEFFCLIPVKEIKGVGELGVEVLTELLNSIYMGLNKSRGPDHGVTAEGRNLAHL